MASTPNGSIITDYGRSVLATATPENQVTIASMGVGDSNGDYPPLTTNMTKLVNEVWRTTYVAGPYRDPDNIGHLIFEAIIPDGDGPFTIREIAIFDGTGGMVAIGQVGTIDKPATGGTYLLNLTVRLRIALDSEGQISLFSDSTGLIEHNDTTGRSLPDSHPIEAISGLTTTLDTMQTAIDNAVAGGTLDHSQLNNRNAADSHPTAAITGLDTALAGKALTVHTHTTAQVTGLDTALAGKSATTHTHDHATLTNRNAADSHPISSITGLQTALDSAASGGTMDHSQLNNRSLVDSHPTAAITGLDTALAGKAPTSHTHTSAQISDATSTNTPNMVVKRDALGGVVLNSITLATIPVAQSNANTVTSTSGVRDITSRSTAVQTGVDFNTLTSIGLYNYSVTGGANAPSTTSSYYVRNYLGAGNNYDILQIATPTNFDSADARVAMRHHNTATGWSAWQYLALTTDSPAGTPEKTPNTLVSRDASGISKFARAMSDSYGTNGARTDYLATFTDVSQITGNVGAAYVAQTDLNQMYAFAYAGLMNGVVNAATVVNGPGNAEQFIVYNFISTGGNTFQIAYPFGITPEGISYRVRYGGTWSAWYSLMRGAADLLGIGTTAPRYKTTVKGKNGTVTRDMVSIAGSETAATIPTTISYGVTFSNVPSVVITGNNSSMIWVSAKTTTGFTWAVSGTAPTALDWQATGQV